MDGRIGTTDTDDASFSLPTRNDTRILVINPSPRRAVTGRRRGEERREREGKKGEEELMRGKERGMRRGVTDKLRRTWNYRGGEFGGGRRNLRAKD